MNSRQNVDKSNEQSTKINQQSVILRIDKVKKQLSKLSDIISHDQQFNKAYIKKILENNQISSSESDQSPSSTHEMLQNLKQNFRLEDLNISSSQSIFLQGIDINFQNSIQNSNNKHQQEETSSALRLQSQFIESQINVAKKQKNNIKIQYFQKNSSFSKKIDNQGVSQFKSEILRPKSLKNINKTSGKTPQTKLSKNKSDIKDLNKIFDKYPMQKKKSSKAMIYKGISHENKKNMQQLNKKPIEKMFLVEPKTKLNKINVNKYKQNLKKNHDQQNNISQGLDEKLHLNLKEILPLMQRLIQKKNIGVEYEFETNRYQKEINDIKEKKLVDEIIQISAEKPQLSELFRLLANFVAQFSQKINKKIISIEIQKFEFKYPQMIKDIKKILSTIPKKLFKNNVVSQIRYMQFMKQSQNIINRVQKIHKESKLYLITIRLKKYLQFLFNNKLIEMTERKNLYTKRKIVEYYSHRSQRDINIIKNKTNYETIKQKKHKKQNKQYDTERKFFLSEQKKFDSKYMQQIKKKNINAFRNNIKKNITIPNKNVIKPQKNIQLSTRSGKMKKAKEDQLKKNKSNNNNKFNPIDFYKK